VIKKTEIKTKKPLQKIVGGIIAMGNGMIDKIKSFFVNGDWLEAIIPMCVNILLAILIYVVGRWVCKELVVFTTKVMKKRGVEEALCHFVTSILSSSLTFIVLLISLEQIGVDTTSLLAVLGAAGLAVGLALKDSLSNFASGVMLIVFKPFKVGDYVEVGGVSGLVELISIFSTELKTLDNKTVIIPNSQVYGNIIINYSAKPVRRADMVVGVSYSDDLKKTQQVIREVLSKDPRILKTPEPVVAVSELGDSSINFIVRPWVKTEDYWVVQWSFLENIKIAFDANDISIPFPQRDVHIDQPPTS
jgi:small conductance mechanosensitive channel